MKSLESNTYAIVDTETTGTSPAFGEIIEIGILRIENGEVVKKYQTLIRPTRRVSYTITGVTGITNEQLESAPSFSEVADDIFDMLDGAVFVAHNARFDYGFLKTEFARIAHPFTAKTLCTVKLSRLLYPEQARHNLDAIIEAHGLTCKTRHRAMDDAQALWDFIEAAEKSVGEGEVLSGINRILKKPTLPVGLNPALFKGMPNTPGVYIFYGEGGEVLYVGKSVKVRSRVLSHFSNDFASPKEMRMCADTVHIECRETSGELSALFLESQLVKDLLPTYNRMLRRAKQLAVVRRACTPDGYASVTLEYTGELDPMSLSSVVSVCRSKAQAKSFLRSMVKEKGLCGKLLGLESGRGSCFGRQIETCQGACIGKEAVEVYNERFDAAFKKYQFKTWPFRGPIVIRDESDTLDGVAYVVHNWCLTEIIEYSDDSASSQKLAVVFDLDSYKILARFLKDRKSRGRVSELPEYMSNVSSGYSPYERVYSKDIE